MWVYSKPTDTRCVYTTKHCASVYTQKQHVNTSVRLVTHRGTYLIWLLLVDFCRSWWSLMTHSWYSCFWMPVTCFSSLAHLFSNTCSTKIKVKHWTTFSTTATHSDLPCWGTSGANLYIHWINLLKCLWWNDNFLLGSRNACFLTRLQSTQTSFSYLLCIKVLRGDSIYILVAQSIPQLVHNFVHFSSLPARQRRKIIRYRYLNDEEVHHHNRHALCY